MTTIHQPLQSHLPPSPPPSSPSESESQPQSRPRPRHKKHQPKDPFLNLDTTLCPKDNEAREIPEPLLTRILLTPLLMTSFLLSLFLINHRDRRRRLHSHPNPPSTSTLSTLLSYLSPSALISPEPYQDPTSSTWVRNDSSIRTQTHVSPHAALNPEGFHHQEGKGDGKKKRAWYLRRKIRRVARLEVSDAFEMRGRVMGAMLVLFGLLFAALGMGLKWVLQWIW
ncbi:hypothetical protein B0J11DRAFT_228497 [Dendryphion nanum]|uniref:Uncharacterized protein n=1 Tax=Dendryphion nanum TaxID=256645 RepID=A0A9P9E803_9PLEO|nr:hypothetical protein B0J11DRAFT_228497 [Dendryphion nanum]